MLNFTNRETPLPMQYPCLGEWENDSCYTCTDVFLQVVIFVDLNGLFLIEERKSLELPSSIR